MFPTFLLIVTSIYVLLYLLDKFYKTCAHYPYIQFLKNTGFEIKPFQVKWETTAFNRILLRWGGSHSSFINSWFTIGLNVTLVFLPVACVLLVVSVYRTFSVQSNAGVASDPSIVVPIIPGANLPIRDLPYYVFSLIVSSVFHEFGHALTAVKEDVHLSNVGISCLFILPVAYVSLNSEDVAKLHPLKSLRIFCAGVWHNIVLSLTAYLILVSLPYVFSPLYETYNGVMVSELSLNSPLRGGNGLSAGERVFKINDCKTDGLDAWEACIQRYRSLKLGLCTHTDVISTYDETVFKYPTANDFNCCGERRAGSLCFEHQESGNGALEIPPHTCLPVRDVVERSERFCNSSSDCPQATHCLKPMLRDNTNLLVVETAGRQVIYLGLSDDLHLTVTVSEYVPRRGYLSARFPNVVEKLFRYVVVISMGLAFVNVVPVLAMDGHFISNALIKLTLGDRIKNERVYFAVTLLVPFCGTLLFCGLVAHAVWMLAFKFQLNAL